MDYDTSQVAGWGTIDKVAKKEINDFLLARSSIFSELAELRARGWANPKGDEHFKNQRKRADQATPSNEKMFYNMMQQIADELHIATWTLHLQTDTPKVLDLCMAPGGYTASILKYNPTALVSAISLPVADGGHKVLVPHHSRDNRVQVSFLDITMLSSEFGTENIPDGHPDNARFLHDVYPYHGESFDLVFCDGQVLRTHTRESYRQGRVHEAVRLTSSQLVLAMQRIKIGGTLIMLLHKVDAWDTIKLLFVFNKMATIELFKPRKKHKLRGSFYLVAKDVDPRCPEAISAVAQWKEDWRHATFGYSEETRESTKRDSETTLSSSHVLAEFGARLVELGNPIWTIQRDALKGAAFIKEDAAETTGER